MHPFLFEVFGRQITTYGVAMLAGVVVAWFFVCLLRHIYPPDEKTAFHLSSAFLICVCGAIVGAFLFRPLTRIPEIIINWESFRSMPVSPFFSFLFGEIVFYGGLIGGIAALLLYCRAYKIPILPIADAFAPAVALGHGIGRIGCFLGGCCYGVCVDAAHPFAVIYPQASLAAPPGVPLLATPLIEAACLFVVAVVLAVIYKKTAGEGFTVFMYGILYSVLRFTLEFYRGDLIRGVYGPFSTSQYISIAVFCASAVGLSIKVRQRRLKLLKY